jgi:hypothetical protein
VEILLGESDPDRPACGLVAGGSCGVTFGEDEGAVGTVGEFEQTPFDSASGFKELVAVRVDALDGVKDSGGIGHGDEKFVIGRETNVSEKGDALALEVRMVFGCGETGGKQF